MAKQNVNFVERHVEKLVVGLAGGITLAVAFLYLINSPNQVEVAGKPLGPEAFYREIRSSAEQARTRLSNYRPSPEEMETVTVLDPERQRSPYDFQSIPKEFSTTFVPPATAVPDVDTGVERGKVRLAEILPPKSLQVTSGRAFVGLPEPRNLTAGDDPADASSIPPITRDHYWVTVLAVVDRKAQRNVFLDAQYAPDRQRLVVGAVEAQRQRLLPNGRWSAPELVQGYQPTVLPRRETVELRRQEDGSYAMTDVDKAYIDAYRDMIKAPEDQARVLRPPFQKYFANDPYRWQVPAMIEEYGISLADYGVEVFVPAPEESARPARALSGRLQVKQEFDEVKNQLAELADVSPEQTPEAFLQAEDALEAILENTDATAKQKAEVNALVRSYRSRFDLAQRAKLKRERLAEAAETPAFGPDFDPLWFNDTSVLPGETYRYRLRLVAFNTYVALTSKLVDPQDARKVLLAGEWSEWSSAARVAPSQYLFVTTARQTTQAARVEMRQWRTGEWLTGAEDLRVADPVAFTADRNEFNYEAVVTEIDFEVDYPLRAEGRRGEISYRQRETASVVLVRADGSVEERITAEDNDRKRELTRAIREEERRRQSQRQSRPRAYDAGT